tara:strand:+ start:2050 stop:2496 length:447 start_codon:yes stop_codon:yes gene_type:complete
MVNKFRVSRARYLILYLIAVALLVYGVLNLFEIIGMLSLVVVLGIIFGVEVRTRMRQLEFFEEHMVYFHGLINVKKVHINYASVTDVTLNQNLYQRILGYGDIAISTPSLHEEIDLNSLQHAEDIQELIMEKIARYRRAVKSSSNPNQ